MKAGNCVWIRRKLVADWSYQCSKGIEKTHFFLWSIHVKYHSRVICSAPWVKCVINTSTADIRTCAEGRCCAWMLFICPATARAVQLFAVSCFQLLAARSRRPGTENCFSFTAPSTPERLRAVFQGEPLCRRDRPTSGFCRPWVVSEVSYSFKAPQKWCVFSPSWKSLMDGKVLQSLSVINKYKWFSNR